MEGLGKLDVDLVNVHAWRYRHDESAVRVCTNIVMIQRSLRDAINIYNRRNAT